MKAVLLAVCVSICGFTLSCAHVSGGKRSSASACPSEVRLRTDVPNEKWVRMELGEDSGLAGWCGHEMFAHLTRDAMVDIGFLPWSESAIQIADEYAAEYELYDNNTGEGALMDRDQNPEDDGYSWAFLHLQIPGEEEPHRVFMSFLKDARRPDIVIVVTGYWMANDNIGLIEQLTLFTEHIDLLVEE